MGRSCFGSLLLHWKSCSSRNDSEGNSRRQDMKNFSYNDLRIATDNFHPRNKIGRGGFGVVYKGILKDGTQVALKALSAQSKQGVNEFLAEINTLSIIRHRNLVGLIGCCVEGVHRVLVYEYLEKGSLDRALLGSNGSGTIKLDWRQRSAICLGIAKGLAYLHEEIVPHIVHRDVKASNILLDKDFTPKIGDFGLAKLFPDSVTHISTRIAGTAGYLAPEYLVGGHLTMKADIYSFGVLLLEIVSGRSSAKSEWDGQQKRFLEWAWQLHAEGSVLDVVDQELESSFPKEEVVKYIKVAFFCTQSTANRRPTMSQVVDMLSRDVRLNEKQLGPPGIFCHSGDLLSSSDKKLSDYGTTSERSSLPLLSIKTASTEISV